MKFFAILFYVLMQTESVSTLVTGIVLSVCGLLIVGLTVRFFNAIEARLKALEINAPTLTKQVEKISAIERDILALQIKTHELQETINENVSIREEQIGNLKDRINDSAGVINRNIQELIWKIAEFKSEVLKSK